MLVDVQAVIKYSAWQVLQHLTVHAKGQSQERAKGMLEMFVVGTIMSIGSYGLLQLCMLIALLEQTLVERISLAFGSCCICLTWYFKPIVQQYHFQRLVLIYSRILKHESHDLAGDLEVTALSRILGISASRLIQEGLDVRAPVQPDLSIQPDISIPGNFLGSEFGPLHEISKGDAYLFFLSPASELKKLLKLMSVAAHFDNSMDNLSHSDNDCW